MAGEVPRTKMNLSGTAGGAGPNHVGRTLIIGGTITFAILYSTWLSMKVRKRHEEALGKNPYYEQVTGNLTRKWNRGELEQDLKPIPGKYGTYSDMPPRFIDTEHHPDSHMTIGKFNKAWKEGHSGNVVREGEGMGKATARNMVPPPQRGRKDGSDKAYTKSPDFVKNYGKTAEGEHRVIANRGEKVNAAHPTSMSHGHVV